jgi:hypothetical protein
MKRFVVIRLVEEIMEAALKKGFKGIFAEATNIRSALLLTEYCGFYTAMDTKGNPILSRYAEYDQFKAIPKEIAEDCRILYKGLQPHYDI